MPSMCVAWIESARLASTTSSGACIAFGAPALTNARTPSRELGVLREATASSAAGRATLGAAYAGVASAIATATSPMVFIATGIAENAKSLVNHQARGDRAAQRLLNWNRARAAFWPYFLRSFLRGSRVT